MFGVVSYEQLIMHVSRVRYRLLNIASAGAAHSCVFSFIQLFIQVFVAHIDLIEWIIVVAVLMFNFLENSREHLHIEWACALIYGYEPTNNEYLTSR